MTLTEGSEFDIFAPENWVVGTVLARRSATHADKTFLIMDGKSNVTYAQADRIADRVAAGLQSAGISKGDRVAVLLPNGLEHCFAWLGIARAGAVHVAVNTEYKGAFLAHVLNDSGAAMLICDADALQRVSDIEQVLPALRSVFVVGRYDTKLARIACGPFDELPAATVTPTAPVVDFRDIGCIMYTSGTTGRSKGVLMPHAHNYLFGLGSVENLALGPEDVYYITLPLFHANGLFMQLYATLIAGASAVVKARFSASAWLADVRRHGVTVTNTLGVMAEFVLNQPPGPDDTEHRLRVVTVAPNTPTLEASFKRRFGIEHVIGLYGMTEVNIPLYAELGVAKPGSCGREYSRCFEVVVADPDTDVERPRGEVGEILVRPRQPFGFMAGYHGMPDKTVEACRNLWFHTGDAATMDSDGYVYFVDRIKDCIRRRGENISSFEIESVIQNHEAVAEAAAIAVPSGVPGGEDEIKIVVVLIPGESLTEPALAAFCEQHMPRFAVPRYIEFVDALPKTPTSKVRKHRLRESGVTPGTWDREQDNRGKQ